MEDFEDAWKAALCTIIGTMKKRRLEIEPGVVEEAINGSEEAWGTIYMAVKPFVTGICIRDFGLSAEDAQDVSHNVICLFAKHLGRIDHHGAWLYRTALTQAAQFREKNGRKAPAEKGSRCPAASVEDTASFWQVFERLGAKCRRIVRYIFLEERTHREAASLLGIPEGSVQHYINKCYEQLLHFFSGGRHER